MTDTTKRWSVVTASDGHPDHDPGTTYSVSATGLTLDAALEMVSDIEHDADEAYDDCGCQPSEIDGDIRCRCTGYPIVTAFHCRDDEAKRYVPEQTLRLPDNPPKMPRVEFTFFSLAMHDRALRDAGFNDEADAAARRFEAVTGIDILADDAMDAEPKPMPRSGYVYGSGYVYAPLPNDLRIHPSEKAKVGMETFEWKARVVRPNGAISPNNRRTRRASAAKARRRSA